MKYQIEAMRISEIVQERWKEDVEKPFHRKGLSQETDTGVYITSQKCFSYLCKNGYPNRFIRGTM